MFFDIPPPSEEERAARQVEERQQVATTGSTNDDGWEHFQQDTGEIPAIESVMQWEQVEATLPKHEKGGIDWMEALEQGLVRPRTGPDPKAADAAAFKYDFFIWNLS